jgi:N4-gp56 family major capsid protein
MAVTKLENMVDPEVMADMISAKLPKAIVATPFAKVDTTLEGRPGSTITVPKYEYIGDAEEVAEGVEQGDATLTTTTAEYTVKKIVKDVTLTDEAVLSGYGNPVGEANSQLLKSIANKVDNDVIDELKTAQLAKKASDVISYNGIVDAMDLLNEEENVDKVMFIAPAQVTTLRKDANFISADKYNNNVIMRGEIGMISNARIVASRKITLDDSYTKTTDVAIDSGKTYYVKTGTTFTAVAEPVLADIGKYYEKDADKYYHCPIVQLRPQSQTGDETAAITIYLKRNVNVEKARIVKGKKTLISADEHYVAALTDESKVVVAKFPAEAITSL